MRGRRVGLAMSLSALLCACSAPPKPHSPCPESAVELELRFTAAQARRIPLDGGVFWASLPGDPACRILLLATPLSPYRFLSRDRAALRLHGYVPSGLHRHVSTPDRFLAVYGTRRPAND